jgi:hypothetical protein
MDGSQQSRRDARGARSCRTRSATTARRRRQHLAGAVWAASGPAAVLSRRAATRGVSSSEIALSVRS